MDILPSLQVPEAGFSVTTGADYWVTHDSGGRPDGSAPASSTISAQVAPSCAVWTALPIRTPSGGSTSASTAAILRWIRSGSTVAREGNAEGHFGCR